jgi:hypothetical protein
MALGGIVAGLDTSVPSLTSSAGVGYQDIQSVKTTFQQVLDSEHHFPSTGGAGSGAHRLGSARVFVGTASQVSSADTTGRLMWTSDTNELFYLSSSQTVKVAGSALTAMAYLTRSTAAAVADSATTVLTWASSAATNVTASGQTATCVQGGTYAVSWSATINQGAAGLTTWTLTGPTGPTVVQQYMISNTAAKMLGSTTVRWPAAGTMTLSMANGTGSVVTLSDCALLVSRIQ